MRPSCVHSGLPLLGALAAFLLASGTAWAGGLPLLVVHRTDDAAGCPDAYALAALVAAQMKRPALEPATEVPPDRGLDVQIYRSERGFTAVIRAGGKTHQLSDKGRACTSLAVALSISIAVLLDTEPLPPEPEPPPLPVAEPRSQPLPLPAQPLPEVPSFSFSPSLPPPSVDPPAEDRVPLPHSSRVTLVAGPAATVGVLQSWAFGLTSEVEVRFGRFSVAAGALVLPGQTFNWEMGQLQLDLTAGLVRACTALTSEENPIRFAACLEPFGGTLRGSGRGFPTDWTSSLPWVALGTSALFEQHLWGPVSWGARAGLVIPLLKASFVVDNAGTAFTPAPVGGEWDAQLRVSIW